jgi:hypothetical protein
MRTERLTLLDLIYEHNFLNGKWFVLGEFLIIMLVTAFVSVLFNLHHAYWLGTIAIGIAANTVAMLYVVTKQLRDGTPTKNLLMNRSREYRDWVMKEYPRLSMHTAVLSLALIAPFSIPILLCVQKNKKDLNKRS